MAKSWVDFKKIKTDVSIKMILDHYGLLEGLKESGGSLVGCCPLKLPLPTAGGGWGEGGYLGK
jgi:hypothetical protein